MYGCLWQDQINLCNEIKTHEWDIHDPLIDIHVHVYVYMYSIDH